MSKHNDKIVYSKEIEETWLPNDFNEKEFPKFSFELDIFQKQGFYLLNNHDSLFVAAHTSSGKTLLTHFCIWRALKENKRVIYTSPIKALSNQKYYEFRQIFSKEEQNVGIVTGDVQINENAPILIMTTEILRNKLYRNDLEGLEYVIFDEVHYMNDKERGVVWEECIIQLRQEVTLLFLSATISNALEFSEWVGRIKDKTVFVIKTNKRVVPLKYTLFKSDEFFDINGKKIDSEARKEKTIKKVPQKNPALKKGQRNINKEFSLDFFLRNIKRDSLPAIFFCFSKKKCEEYMNTCGSISYNSMSDRKKIEEFLGKNKIESPFKNYWYKGLAVHHSGLLPSEKESVEMLFARNLIKILFATETMAMGLNMPAKSVIFLSPFKKGMKLTTTEMLQMSGRAGRRGLDTEGKVYVNCEKLNREELKKIIYGNPAPLVSAFRVTFNLLLMLIKNNLEAQEYLKRSFGALYIQRTSSENQEMIKMLERKIDGIDINGDEAIKDFARTICSVNTQEYSSNAAWVIDYSGNYGIIDRIVNDRVIFKSKTESAVFSAPFISAPQKTTHAEIHRNDVFLVGGTDIVGWNESLDFLKSLDVRNHVLYVKLLKIIEKIERLKSLAATLLKKHTKLELIALVREESAFLFNKKSLGILKDSLDYKNLIFATQYENRIRFLEDKKYIENGKLLIKGQVASEIRTLNDIITTEMLFHNEFNDLNGEEILSIFSCMISNEKEVYRIKKKMSDISIKYGEESDECKLSIENIDLSFLNALESYEKVYHKELIEYNISDNFELNYNAVRPVYLWCKEDPLGLCVKNAITKGGFVRVVLRIHESIREIKTTCHIIGNDGLKEKLEKFETIILRGAVVEESLYVREVPLLQ